MNWDILKLIACPLGILLASIILYLVWVRVRGIAIANRTNFATQFVITILGTTVGFSMVTISTMYLQRINDKQELLILLGNTYKETDIAYKSLLFSKQSDTMTYLDKDLLLRLGPFPTKVKVECMFVQSLYQDKFAYRYLSKTFTKNRLFLIYRGMQNFVRKSENKGFFQDKGNLEAAISRLKLYLAWEENEGISLSGSKEKWEKVLNLFDSWNEIMLSS